MVALSFNLSSYLHILSGGFLMECRTSCQGSVTVAIQFTCGSSELQIYPLVPHSLEGYRQIPTVEGF